MPPGDAFRAIGRTRARSSRGSNPALTNDDLPPPEGP